MLEMHFLILEVFLSCEAEAVPVITIKHSKFHIQRQRSVFSSLKGTCVLHSEGALNDKRALHGIFIQMIET
jgi:hypothetical protein